MLRKPIAVAIAAAFTISMTSVGWTEQAAERAATQAASLPSFKQLDTNADGELSKEETEKQLTEAEFDLADINGNSRLSATEFRSLVADAEYAWNQNEGAQSPDNQDTTRAAAPMQETQQSSADEISITEKTMNTDADQTAGTTRTATADNDPSNITNDEPSDESEIISKTAGDLIGREVVNIQGEELGEVEAVVVNEQDQSIAVVIGVGGILGFMQTDVIVPLDQLQLRNNRVLISSAMTEDEMKSRTRYDEKTFRKVPHSQRLADLNLGGQTGASLQSEASIASSSEMESNFRQLDVNRDGYVSATEAPAASEQESRWKQADQNQDGKLDRSEFSAFEQQAEVDRSPSDSSNVMESSGEARVDQPAPSMNEK